MRTIYVVSNLGNKLIKIESDEIKTAADLKAEINRINVQNGAESVNFSNVEMVVGGRNTSLNLDTAAIPDGDQRVFLMQKEGKAGGSDRKEAYETINGLIMRYGDEAREFFNSGGVNFTNKRTVLLLELIDGWNTRENEPAGDVRLEEYVQTLNNLIMAHGSSTEINAFNELLRAAGLGSSQELELLQELRDEYCGIASQSRVFKQC